jgi:hypothetical protein
MPDPKKPEPEIMPPVPDVKPGTNAPEIPDIDAPQKEAPEQGSVEAI